MAVNFPASPSQDDIYTYNGVKYVFDGTKWVSGGSTPSFVLKSGDTMTGDLNVANVYADTNLDVGGQFSHADTDASRFGEGYAVLRRASTTSGANSYMLRGFHGTSASGDGGDNKVFEIGYDGTTKIGGTAASPNITFSPDGKGTFATGVLFGTDTADVNTLDDYEEGTWTPIYEPQSNSFSSITYDAVVYGYYQKIGETVYLHGFIRTDALTIGSATGNIYVGGLPFEPVNAAGENQGFHIPNVGNWGGDYPWAMMTTSGQRLAMYYRTSLSAGTSVLQVSDMGTGVNANQVYFWGRMRVA